MGRPPKRRSLDKVDSGISGATKSRNFYCCRCGIAYSRLKGYFPVSHSPMYRGTGYLPFCSDCLETMYDDYRAKLGDRGAVRRICMKADLYWSDDIYDMVERSAGVNSRIRSYIGKTNLVRFIDKTFDDTIREEAEKALQLGDEGAQRELSEESVEIEETPQLTMDDIGDEVISFWGPGYTPEMYMELEDRKRYWISGYPDGYLMDIGEEAIIRQICNLEIDINHDRAAGKDTDKKINTLNTLIGSMNLKPTQKKASDGDGGLDGIPYGSWIAKLETTRPVPEPDPEFKDVNKIVWYITVFFYGHLCSMLHIKNTYCQMYEDEIRRLRVEHPEFEDEDDETVFNEVFASQSEDGD